MEKFRWTPVGSGASSFQANDEESLRTSSSSTSQIGNEIAFIMQVGALVFQSE